MEMTLDTRRRTSGRETFTVVVDKPRGSVFGSLLIKEGKVRIIDYWDLGQLMWNTDNLDDWKEVGIRRTFGWRYDIGLINKIICLDDFEKLLVTGTLFTILSKESIECSPTF